jgi:NADP-dependent 3-hydroxy acid dehydrogenase YdfG
MAGIEGKVAPVAEYDEAVFDQVIGINVKGVFPRICATCCPCMLKQKSGAVVNTAVGRRPRGHARHVGLCSPPSTP